MSLLSPKKRGDPLSARYINRLRQGVVESRTRSGSPQAEVRRGVGGTLVGTHPSRNDLARSIDAKLTSAETAERFALTQVFGGLNALQAVPLIEVQRPTSPSDLSPAIVIDGMIQSRIGKVQLRGICPVYYDAAHAVAAGDRLGYVNDSYVATYNAWGPLYVLEIMDAADRLAMVLIDPINGIPKVYIATADAAGGEITGKWLSSDCTENPPEETFVVLSCP